MDNVEIRPARLEDADQIADVYMASFRDTYDFPLAHDDEQVRGWTRDVVMPTEEVRVAVTTAGGVVAMMALRSDVLDQFYSLLGGLAGALAAVCSVGQGTPAPRSRPLYIQVNTRARRFYERHGFVETARGDGSDNEEGQPDVRYSWRP